MQPEIVCVGGIFIDDIVLPNGETRMAVLGGGAAHAAAGAAVWDRRAGIHACVGRDLPDSARQRLARDFDVQGLVWLDLPQARAWQLFEWDAQRREVFRVEQMDPFVYQPHPHQLPAAYHAARAAYLLRDGASIAGWRAAWPQATLLWEPLQQVMVAAQADAFRAALPLVAIVSPNQLEVQQIYGCDDPLVQVAALLDDGASTVALRMGAAGSLVASADGAIHIPAVPVPHVVDQTGAGNTYCGGFLAGWLATGSLQEAGCFAAVAASFALESTGIANPPPDVREGRDERLAWLRARVERIAL